MAAEVAKALQAPLGLVLVRKIGAPGQPELAVAAVGVLPGNPLGAMEQVVDEETLRASGADHAYVNRCMPVARRELERRHARYTAGRTPIDLRGRPVVLVDDGIATGTTARAAIASVRRAGASHLLLAVPVASAESLAQLRAEVDELVCLQVPQPFHAVGAHYRAFSQVDDEAVIADLNAQVFPPSSEGTLRLGRMLGETGLRAAGAAAERSQEASPGPVGS